MADAGASVSDANSSSCWAYTDDYAAIEISEEEEEEEEEEKEAEEAAEEDDERANADDEKREPAVQKRRPPPAATAELFSSSLAARSCCNPYRWHDAWCKILFDLDGGDLNSIRSSRSLRSLTLSSSSTRAVDGANERAAALLILRSLVNDYTAAVEKYAKLIISERDVDPQNRLLRPVAALGGFAGGDKYLVGGILFKFADGVPLPTELANKIPGIEFNAAVAVHDSADRTKARQLIVPLTCIVDYMGHRLEAVAFSPCSANTLVYGSSDAARTIFKSDEETNRLMAALGENLCLAPHLVRERSTGKDVELILSDIEVHRIKQRTLNMDLDTDADVDAGADWALRLVLDSSRLFPPLPPVLGAHRLLHLARRFRPELVALFGKPVNNDLFTNFQSPDDPLKRAYYNDVRELRRFLSGQIESAARRLYSIYRIGRHVKNVTSFLRSYGINMHLLGEVRAAMMMPRIVVVRCRRDETARQCCMALLLTEIVARTFKNLIRSSFRKVLAPNKAASASAKHSEFSDALLGFLSTAFGARSRYRCKFNRPPLSHAEEWNRAAEHGAHLKEAVLVRFRGALTSRERQGTFDLLRHGLLSEFSLSDQSRRVQKEGTRFRVGRDRFMRLLFARLSDMLGLRLSEEATLSCCRFSPKLGWPFDTRLVASLRPVSKTLGGFAYMEGCRALALAKAVVLKIAVDVSRVKWFGRSSLSLVGRGRKQGRAPTPGKQRVNNTFGYEVGAVPREAADHLKLAIGVLSRATARKATDALTRLALAEALYLRGTFWADLDDLKECHHHLEAVSRLRGGSSQVWYKCVLLMKDLLFALDRLSHRLIRKLLSLSSQITLGRSPDEVEEIGRVVHALSCVAMTARRGVYRHDRELQIIALRVELAVAGLKRRLRWQNAICCCSNDSEKNRCCGNRCAWGRRGVFHPADVIFLCGGVLTVIWVLIDAITDVDGFAGLTRENAKAVSLLSELLSSSSGLLFLGVVSRKATKRLGFRRRMFVLAGMMILASLVIGHVAVTLAAHQGAITKETGQRLRPVSTLALFFCSLCPTIAWFLIQLVRVYYHVRAGNSAAMTAHNPFDFLDKCYIPRPLERGQQRQQRQHEGEEEEEQMQQRQQRKPTLRQFSAQSSYRGSVTILHSVSRPATLLLRQSSKFGAMSRFSAGDLDEQLLVDGFQKSDDDEFADAEYRLNSPEIV